MAHKKVDSLTCPQCGADNPGKRKFCGQCGAPLWEPCLKCGALCSAAERFCGACGANLAAGVQQATEEFQARLREAQRLQSEGGYEEALALLEPVAKADHPRLSGLAARAGELITQTATLRSKGLAIAEERLEEARRSLAAHDYDAAAAALESIPAALRDDAARGMLAQITARREELQRLGADLREALRLKQVAGLLPKIQRLLELNPDHPQARQVGLQLQKKYCRAAEEKLALFQYDQARTLLDMVPPALHTPEFAVLHERVADLAWIVRDLRLAPVADRPLVELGQRLRHLAPDDAKALGLVAAIQRRIAATKKNGRVGPPPWAVPPETTPFGCPVDGLYNLERLACGEGLDRALLAENPGRLAVACGLALQGIGQAAADVNLVPSGRHGVLDLLGQLVRKRAGRAAWGIDIGSSAVKAVKLAWDEKADRAEIEGVAVAEHRKPLDQAHGEDEEGELLEETLSGLLTRCDVKGHRVCVGLSGRSVLVRQFQLPPADPARLASMVQYEARRVVPMRLEDLCWGCARLERREEEPGRSNGQAAGGGNVLFAAVKRVHAEKRLEMFQRLGVRVDVLQSECLAMFNLMVHECFAPPPKAAADAGETADAARAPLVPAAIIDVGSDGSNLVLGSPVDCALRHLGFGGDLITRVLVKDFNLTIAQAEQLKRNPATAPCVSKYFQAVAPLWEDFLKEILVTLEAVNKVPVRPVLKRVVLVGGASSLHGLLGYLRSGS